MATTSFNMNIFNVTIQIYIISYKMKLFSFNLEVAIRFPAENIIIPSATKNWNVWNLS